MTYRPNLNQFCIYHVPYGVMKMVRMIDKQIKNWRSILLAGLVTFLPLGALAEKVEENPSGMRMMADLFIARPVGIVLLGLGSTVYLVTLPFSLLGGNAKEAGSQLVVEPAREAFIRCLGCSTSGRKEKIR